MEGPLDAVGQRSVWPRIIISGHAKLPQDAAARAVFELLTVVVAVEPDTGRVLDVDSSLVTDPAKVWLRDLLMSAKLSASSGPILDAVERYYWGGAKKAVAAAIRDLYTRWEELDTHHRC